MSDEDDAYLDVFEVAYDERRRRVAYGTGPSFIEGVLWGAGWMAAIIGMGQAIRLGRFCLLCDRSWGGNYGPDVCRYCCGC